MVVVDTTEPADKYDKIEQVVIRLTQSRQSDGCQKRIVSRDGERQTKDSQVVGECARVVQGIYVTNVKFVWIDLHGNYGPTAIV